MKKNLLKWLTKHHILVPKMEGSFRYSDEQSNYSVQMELTLNPELLIGFLIGCLIGFFGF